MKQNAYAPAFCAAALLLLSACQSTQIALKSDIAVPQSFSGAEAARGGQEIAQWWQNWHDPVLSRLIGQGLEQGHDVKIAVSRLNEARAVGRAASAELGPTVGLSGQAGAVRGEADNPLGALAGSYPQAATLGTGDAEIKGNQLVGGISASWEPDIFGRKRSDADAARYAALG